MQTQINRGVSLGGWEIPAPLEGIQSFLHEVPLSSAEGSTMRWGEVSWPQQNKLKEESRCSKHHQWFLLLHVRATLLSLDLLLLPSLDFGLPILLQGSLQLSWKGSLHMPKGHPFGTASWAEPRTAPWKAETLMRRRGSSNEQTLLNGWGYL